MKSAIQLTAAAGVGALVAFAIPMSVLNSTLSTLHTLGTRVEDVRLADLNPVPAVLDWGKKKTLVSETLVRLGFHPSAAASRPVAALPAAFHAGPYSGKGSYAPARDEIDRNSPRAADMHSATSTAMGWHGAPPD